MVCAGVQGPKTLTQLLFQPLFKLLLLLKCRIHGVLKPKVLAACCFVQ